MDIDEHLIVNRVVAISDYDNNKEDDNIVEDNQSYQQSTEWSVLHFEYLIKSLTEEKLKSIKNSRLSHMYHLKMYNSNSTISNKSKRSSLKSLDDEDLCPKCHHVHNKPAGTYFTSRSRVRNWQDEDANMPFNDDNLDEGRISRKKKIRSKKETADFQDAEKQYGKKKRAKKCLTRQQSRRDSGGLSKGARWTIIITSAMLILTCMFMVGITLRMAPVIDQLVRTQNEQLMNSLNRKPPAPSLNNTGTSTSSGYKTQLWGEVLPVE